MANKSLIKRILKLTGILTGAAGLIFLLAAAVRIREEQVCTAVVIRFPGASEGKYVGRTDIARQMWPGGIDGIKNRSLKALDLALMEHRIEQDPWVKNAELFIDGQNRLQVVVEEKEPIARIFNRDGQTFYIDASLKLIPLNRHHTPDLPVFTGLPVSQGDRQKMDSLMLSQVRTLLEVMGEDSLWDAQLVQCAYEPPLGFVFYPLLGNHRIIFGDASHAREKFRKLFVFYAQVLSREGWNAYRTIDLRFDRQIVTVPTQLRSNPWDSVARMSKALWKPKPTDPPIETAPSSDADASDRVVNAQDTPRLIMPKRRQDPR